MEKRSIFWLENRKAPLLYYEKSKHLIHSASFVCWANAKECCLVFAGDQFSSFKEIISILADKHWLPPADYCTNYYFGEIVRLGDKVFVEADTPEVCRKIILDALDTTTVVN
ncbi:MAG TPA: hypothetical protein GX706_00555 [Candidatus Moranbacteria bacterium]|nr:hypothetical protein [Candidatus Moranbacteria bacterium]